MNICVVGDLLLDVDLAGTATRLCADAPVPVIDVMGEGARAGGAGLVATLLAADGHDVTLVTAMASDGNAARLWKALEGVTVLCAPLNGPTPVKTRLRANGAHVARIDTACGPVSPPAATAAMLEACAMADAIVVADYGRGLLADPRLRAVLQSRACSVPVVWDPHPHGVAPVPGVAAVTPNLAEALAASGQAGEGLEVVARSARILLRRWGSRSIIVTLAERGALMLQEADPGAAAPQVVPAVHIDAADSCGAGDRFASALVVLLGGGQPISDAVQGAVAVTAGFLAGGGVGTLQAAGGAGAAATPPSQDAIALASRVRAAGGKVVATGGCFDLLHAGHIRMLANARELGDCLVVLLNSDSSVERMKGPDRPIIDERDRIEMLLALSSVDAVLVFSEDTPERALGEIRPDLWVKGGDYSVDRLPETRALQGWGGRAVTVPYHPERSTTLLAQALARAGR